MSSISAQIFHHRQPDWTQLPAYGFTGAGTQWTYTTPLVSDLSLTVAIDGANITTTVSDRDSGEPYVLHLDPANSGMFVGEVRGAYMQVLTDIAAKCFVPTTFASGQSAAIVAALTEKYDEAPEYLWKKFPNNAIIRRADTRKWYALLVKVGADKIGLDGTDPIDLLVVRAKPATVAAKLKAGSALPAYHMNKQHWLSYRLDDHTATPDLLVAIADSRALAH